MNDLARSTVNKSELMPSKSPCGPLALTTIECCSWPYVLEMICARNNCKTRIETHFAIMTAVRLIVPNFGAPKVSVSGRAPYSHVGFGRLSPSSFAPSPVVVADSIT